MSMPRPEKVPTASAATPAARRPARPGPAARLALALALLAPGCVVVPRTTEVYDEQCQIQARHMELEVQQVGVLGHCVNEGCVAMLVVFGAVTAASAVVSGSIVIAGNVAYWFEKKGECAP